MADELDLEALLEAPYRQESRSPRDDRGHRKRRRSRSRDDRLEDRHRRSRRSSRSRSRSNDRDRRRRDDERRGSGDPRDSRPREPTSAPRVPAAPALTREERDLRTVFVVQLSQRVREVDVGRFFEKVGKIRDVRLIGDRVSNRSKGMAYVEFYDLKSVPAAVALTGKKLMGVPVIVQESEAERNRKVEETPKTEAPVIIPPKQLLVVNLHPALTAKDVRQIFAPFGTIETFELVMESPDRSNGTAYVEYSSPVEANNAQAKMNGVEIAGGVIQVSIVKNDATDSAAKNAQVILDPKRIAQNAVSKVIGNDDDGHREVHLTSQGRAALMAKLSRDPAMVQRVMGIYPSASQKQERNCMLTNMFNPDEETEANWDLEIKADVEMECSKFGAIEHSFVDKPTMGHVYIKFKDVDGCAKACQALNGRWFAGRQVIAQFVDDATYTERTSKA